MQLAIALSCIHSLVLEKEMNRKGNNKQGDLMEANALEDDRISSLARVLASTQKKEGGIFKNQSTSKQIPLTTSKKKRRVPHLSTSL